jgi:ABC-2 type transport system ATP-binding protein
MTTVQRTLAPDLAVEAFGLGKQYGDRWVLEDLDLAVPRGSVLGLLGPNGAGKTTTVRLLATLTEPTAGTARVAGIDVVGDPAGVREHIGLAAQAVTVDNLLTGRANIELAAVLSRLPMRRARERATELLERFDLVDAADTLVKTYSGGMRRRLDLAAGIVANPEVLFLDEPTTGLDPRSRNGLWEVVRELTAAGTTIVLTTQYLEEADVLADEIVVIDHGKAIANGSPTHLKSLVGGPRAVITLPDESGLQAASEALRPVGTEEPIVDNNTLEVSVALAPQTGIGAAALALESAGLPTNQLALRAPSLDDVFLTLTGERAETEPEKEAA